MLALYNDEDIFAQLENSDFEDVQESDSEWEVQSDDEISNDNVVEEEDEGDTEASDPECVPSVSK